MTTEELKNKIIEANKNYRLGNNSGYSDTEYDELLDQYKNLVSEDEYVLFAERLNEGTIETGDKIKHKFIAGSLNKLKFEEPDTIYSFLKKNVKNKLSVSAKVDGISCILHYINGKLIEAITRGDGYEGINITDKVNYIHFIPQEIKNKNELYIRGELVILKKDYDKIDGTSARNVCAGLINRKEYNSDDIDCISFIAYTIMGPNYCKVSQFEELEYNEFTTSWHINIDKEECISDDFINQLFEMASQDFDYTTDGLVLSDTEYVNEDKYKPDCQVAFKTNQQNFESRLIDIEWQGPSKDGRMNCLGILEPTDCGGVIVSKVTMHNLDFLKKTNVKIGDYVQITRSGDVIPKFIKVNRTTPESIDIDYPKTCPCCGSELVQEGPFLYCKNENCTDKTTYQVMHFIKKLGIDYASFKTLKNLHINTIEDLVKFNPNSKYKSEVKLYNELKTKMYTKSKKDIFCALNMKDLSETLQSKIVDFFGFDKIESNEIDSESFSSLPDGIGDITMNKFMDEYKKNLGLMKLITESSNYNPKEEIFSEKNNVKKTGISVCFTGTLNSMGRSEASKLAESNGWEVKISITKGLSFLVQADPNSKSSKTMKAIKNGTKIIGEEEFLKMMNNKAMEVDDF